MSDDAEHPQPHSETAHGGAPLSLREIELLLAEIREEDLAADLTLPDPPTGVWAEISGKLATATDQPSSENRAAPGGALRAGDDLDQARAMRAMPVRRIPAVPRWAVLGAAASVLVVAAVSLALFRERGDSGSVAGGPVVATAVLAYDPVGFDPRGAGASATAELIESDGVYSIQLIDVDLPTVSDDDLELWLIEPDAAGNPTDIAPIALLDGTGPYVLPAGVDPTSHFVVDISIEPRDGDTAHSGDSILRGPLT